MLTTKSRENNHEFYSSSGLFFTTMVGMVKEPKLSIVAKGDIKNLVFELESQSNWDND